MFIIVLQEQFQHVHRHVYTCVIKGSEIGFDINTPHPSMSSLDKGYIYSKRQGLLAVMSL